MENNIQQLNLDNFFSKVKIFDNQAIEKDTISSNSYIEILNECFRFLQEKELKNNFSKREIFIDEANTSEKGKIKNAYLKLLQRVKNNKTSEVLLNKIIEAVTDQDDKTSIVNYIECVKIIGSQKGNLFLDKIKDYFKSSNQNNIDFINKKLIETLNSIKDNRAFQLKLTHFYIEENINLILKKEKYIQNIEEEKLTIFKDISKTLNNNAKKEANIVFLSNYIKTENYDLFMSQLNNEERKRLINSIQLTQRIFSECPEFRSLFTTLLNNNEINPQTIYNSIRDSKGNHLSLYLLEEFGARDEIKTHLINCLFVAKNQDKHKNVLVNFFNTVMDKYKEDSTYLNPSQMFLIFKRCSHSGLLTQMKEYYSFIYQNDKAMLDSISDFMQRPQAIIPSYKSNHEFNMDLMFNFQMRKILKEVLEENLIEQVKNTKKPKI